jgi:hypothetical protein
VLAVGEDVVLHRQIGAPRVHQVEARQPVLEGDLLRAEVLLDRHREVGAALHGGVVGDEDALDSLDQPDAGHHPRPRRLVVVQAGGRQRGELQEGAARIDQPIDPFADGHLAALTVPRDGPLVAARSALADCPGSRPEVIDQAAQGSVIRDECVSGGVEGGAEDSHRCGDYGRTGTSRRARPGSPAARAR